MSPPHERVVPFLDLGAMTREIAHEVEVAWAEITATSSFIGGKWIARFEEEWASYCGTKHAVGVANGTDAIELTLRALGIGPGAEVILPTNTFVATAEAVVLAGATPRFVDVAPDTLLVTPDAIAAAVTSRTSAVIPVHLFGNMPDMEAIGVVARRHGLAVIEDAAQAQGAGSPGARAGSFGVAGCFSFYPGKNLGAFGDAGAVVTDDDDLARRIRSLGDHGRSTSHTRHDVVGRNSRLDALQAAVLTCKLPKLDEWNAARRHALSTYREMLPEGRIRPVRADPNGVGHLNVVLVRDRERLREQLGRHGIQTGVHYPVPCHLQRPYRPFRTDALPVAEAAAPQLLSLPLFPHLGADDIRYVSERVLELVEADAA
jgi:dTDP-4-amino-4,6-dideoxygalactose transaminase